ncbi:MAG: hypothetical protein U0414_22980 [Polyangiaceae bacterium]
MPPRDLSLALSFALAALAIATEARAETEVAIEPRGSLVMVDGDPYPGVGASVDVGFSMDLEPIVLQPELRVVGEGYPSLPGGSARVMAGVRAGIAWKFEPSIFTHFGWGFVGNDTFTSSGYALDAGLSADYRLKRWITIGGSVGYELVVNDEAAHHGVFVGPRLGLWID